MKREYLILVGIFIFSSSSQSQEAISEKNSISIKIASSFLYNSHYLKPKAETFLPTGASLWTNEILKKRASLSLGVHILYESYITRGFISIDHVYTGPIKSIHKVSIYGIPVRFNYLLTGSDKKIKVYINSELENSLVIDHNFDDPELFSPDRYYVGYNLFLGAGGEMDLKIIEKLSFTFEPSAHYSIIGPLTQMKLFSFQFGLKYKLSKE